MCGKANTTFNKNIRNVTNFINGPTQQSIDTGMENNYYIYVVFCIQINTQFIFKGFGH